MKSIVFVSICLVCHFTIAQDFKVRIATEEGDPGNEYFMKDPHWRGADGAASVDLEDGRILWLFSDTFINKRGKGERRGSTMIRNSIGIQDNPSITESNITFHYGGSESKPKDFFELEGENWFWTGHGLMIGDKLIVFLFEETSSDKGLGFEAVGWSMAMINNPYDDPSAWEIRYTKGPEMDVILVGSSAVLKDDKYVYAFGEMENGTHDVYLFRFRIEDLLAGITSGLEVWIADSWEMNFENNELNEPLFSGQTEFSVHYDKKINKYIQIQTYGFGKASIGYRLSDQLHGPWSIPELFYTPELKDSQEIVYSANAHPEIKSDGLLITYNVNNLDFGKLVRDQSIYFPRFIVLKSSDK